ncbi:hypothetical protein P154DRAFT_518241 [Amniculicola lignicola CBS 123094]|uniref:Uncharacterized protein n=1 Tax=Amniculicola lignicola CBS 123094 TaxID=1392246 RepID=A0A6A5WW26_9PLEO|nr:hypothetical protein P154DRAFT_518241 [Amniculicola lignicola CBS 123094]
MVEKRIVDEQERAIAPSMDEWRWAKARYEVGKDGKLSKLSEQLASTVDLEDGKAENADLDISGATKGQGKVEIGAVGELGKVVAKVDEKVENGNGLAHRLSTDRPEAAQKNQIESVQVKEEVGHKEECKETYDDGEEGGSALKKQKLLE